MLLYVTAAMTAALAIGYTVAAMIGCPLEAAWSCLLQG